jgi:hypothetical protein
MEIGRRTRRVGTGAALPDTLHEPELVSRRWQG